MSGSTTPAAGGQNVMKRRSERVQLAVNERVKRGRAAIDDEGRRLKAALEAELARSSTHPDWIPRTSPSPAELTGTWETYRFDAGSTVKEAVQIPGHAYGCHSCLTMAATDPNQPWTGDHCPPTRLSIAARRVLGLTGKTHLFPQCKECSDRQPGLLNWVNGFQDRDLPMVFTAMPVQTKKLLTGGRAPRPTGAIPNCLVSSSTTVQPHERVIIQAMGANPAFPGCHTCDTMVPCPGYVADHVVPKFLVSEGFRELFEMLDMEDLTNRLIFRPQCQRCSNKQGGTVAALAVEARDYGRKLGIFFAEDPSVREPLPPPGV